MLCVYNRLRKGGHRQMDGMKRRGMARKTARKWTRETPYTTMIGARIDNQIADTLHRYVDDQHCTITDVVERALRRYLRGRGYPC